MKKTLAMLAAAAAVAGMFSTSAEALCVSVKTNLQLNNKGGNNAAANTQNCDRSTFANRQFGDGTNTVENKQDGETVRLLNTQRGSRNEGTSVQKGTRDTIVKSEQTEPRGNLPRRR